MATANLCVFIGNLTRDPDVTFIASGQPLAKFGLAVNSSYKNRDGEKVERTDFLNVVAWGKLAELSEQYLHKGSPIYFEGRAQHSTWETEDGQKRSAIDFVASNIQFLAKRSEEPQAPPQTNGAANGEDIDLGDDIPW